VKILEGGPRNIRAVGTAVLLMGALAIGFFSLPSVAHASSAPVGMVIPLYGSPGDGTWSAVIQAKESHPNVQFITIIWPTTSEDSATLQGVENLQAAGIRVVGYAATDYGHTSISSLESQVADFKNWYNVNGIMFDEMNNTVADQSYYTTLNNYVHSTIPGSLTVGNPGTQVPDALIGTFNMLIVYERASYPTLSFITYPGYPPSDFGMIAHGVPLETSFLTSISGIVGWVYLTDSAQSYDVLPSYFTTEVATLASMGGGSASTSASLSVSSVNLAGQTITGMWTTLSQNGATLATGFTPKTFTGSVGGSYVLHVGNYGSTVFCHWQDGNTNAYRPITLTGNTAYTAYYSTTGSCGSTASATTVSVTVISETTGGTQYKGMWLTVASNGQKVDSGFTPLTFQATVGDSYTISMSNYEQYVFAYWSGGNTNPVLTISPTQSTTLTAYYNT